jgi:hypothetical protein
VKLKKLVGEIMSILSKEAFFKLFGSGAFIAEKPLYTSFDDVKVLIALSRTFYPKTVIEIGIQRGETAKCILDNSPWIEKYIGIDVIPSHQTTLPVQRGEVPQIAGECVKMTQESN